MGTEGLDHLKIDKVPTENRTRSIPSCWIYMPLLFNLPACTVQVGHSVQRVEGRRRRSPCHLCV